MSQLWAEYDTLDQLEVFFEKNLDSLHMCRAISTGILKPTRDAELLIGKTWDDLLETIEIEDEAFEDLDEIMDYVRDVGV